MEEDEFDDWPDTTPITGSATPGQTADDDDEYPVGTLWLPDPEARRGWSMRHVWCKEPPKERHVGFRRR